MRHHHIDALLKPLDTSRNLFEQVAKPAAVVEYEDPQRKALQACVAAYALAAKDPQTKMPSYLMAALEQAKAAL